MLCYRIHYDGESKKFVMDETKTPAGKHSDLEWWMDCDYTTAKRGVDKTNNRMKQDISELKEDNDFVVRTCKDCGGYHIITGSMVTWYSNKNLKLPVRCPACINARKQKRTQEV